MPSEVRVEALSIRSDPARIRDVRSWIATIARSAGFSEGDTHDLAVALSEVCSNSYRHSYGGRTDGRIDLEAELSSGRLRLTVRDYGAAFEATGGDAPCSPELAEGGYGLFLIRALTDEVNYTKLGVGTRVVLVKLRRKESE